MSLPKNPIAEMEPDQRNAMLTFFELRFPDLEQAIGHMRHSHRGIYFKIVEASINAMREGLRPDDIEANFLDVAILGLGPDIKGSRLVGLLRRGAAAPSPISSSNCLGREVPHHESLARVIKFVLSLNKECEAKRAQRQAK